MLSYCNIIYKYVYILLLFNQVYYFLIAFKLSHSSQQQKEIQTHSKQVVRLLQDI